MLQIKNVSLIGLVLLTCAGCSDGNFTVYPVSGKVLLDGKPMEGGGSIAFVPTEGQDGKGAGGIIDEDGTYKLSTYADGDGSMPGKFRVVIMQTSADEPEATPDGEAPAGEAIILLSKEKMIPAVYSDFNASPLTATVEKGENELDFKMTRDAGQPAPQQTGA